MLNSTASIPAATPLEEQPWPVRGLAATELGTPWLAAVEPAVVDPPRDARGRFRSRRSELAFQLAG